MGGAGARDRLSEFAAARGLTLAAIEPLSQTQLDFAPRAGRWSIGEIADHLMLAETLYRNEVAALVALARAGLPAHRRHSFSEVNVAPLYIPDAVLSAFEIPFGLMSRFVPDLLRELITEYPIVPTRNPDVATPRLRRPKTDLTADLGASIAKTRALIAENADLDFDALVSEHPLTGRTNVAQILAFLSLHERRHQRQMAGVRDDPRFPHG